MTTESVLPPAPTATLAGDQRGSLIPTGAMITTRLMELRKRRGLMAALIVVTIGIPTVFLLVRLLLHAVAPKTYGPAGGYEIYTALTTGVLYVFGFIVAAALGCTAGSVDLTDGMFRHLVVTGRSRLALYLARIPAGLAIIIPLVAVGFSIVCAVCVYAAPTTNTYNGIKVPASMSKTQLEVWATDHAIEVVCNFGYGPDINVVARCGNGALSANGRGGPGAPVSLPLSTPSQIQAAAVRIADQNYAAYGNHFTVPPDSLMVKTGLWIELEAIVGFIVGLGVGSLTGQRTVGVILMIILEVVLTPLFIRARIPHFINVQRSVIGVATSHLEPSQLPLAFGGGGSDFRVGESTTTAVIVVLAWLIGWTALGAWRMSKRDV